MSPEIIPTGKTKRMAEDIFVELFCETYGPDQAEYLHMHYPFMDFNGNSNFINFALFNATEQIAIEINAEVWQSFQQSSSPNVAGISKQNSLTHQGWRVYRWIYEQLKDEPEKVKDEMASFLGKKPVLREINFCLPRQRGRSLRLGNDPENVLKQLEQMRNEFESIAVLYDAQGDTKYEIVAKDAKKFDRRTLVITHNMEQAHSFQSVFSRIWPDAGSEVYSEQIPENIAFNKNQIIFSTFQTIVYHLSKFNANDFDYLILDEYDPKTFAFGDRILNFFETGFVVGLTGYTNSDTGNSMLGQYKDKASRISMEKAVEIDEIPPIKCFRIKTGIDLSSVRINGMKYNAWDLEEKIQQSRRNSLILEAWLNYAQNRRTIVFCSSIAHTQELAILFRESSVPCAAVSGTTKPEARQRLLEQYKEGDIKVLFASDFLNESWNHPSTDTLFMAFPMLSKKMYLQQLCRGICKKSSKDHLLVVDFIDQAQYCRIPWSAHRIFKVPEYIPGAYVLASQNKMQREMKARGNSLIPPEPIDLFCWQDEAKKMISQLEIEKQTGIPQWEIERLMQKSKIKPDLEVPYGNGKTFKYFYEETIKA